VSVTLIDKRNYHLFRPMLYQVATGLLSGDEISSPLRSIFSGQKNVQILFDEVTGINSGQRVVHLGRGDVPYDYLILANWERQFHGNSIRMSATMLHDNVLNLHRKTHKLHLGSSPRMAE
jgi:NADH dehydrogenase FAD-containing subunit